MAKASGVRTARGIPGKAPSADGDKATARAYGRSLSDFFPLLPGEMRLKESCRRGDIADFGKASEDSGARLEIRAGFLRFLALGGDPTCAIHEHGIKLMGAEITDQLDLADCAIVVPLAFHDCHFTKPIIARSASFKKLVFSHTSIVGFLGDGSTFEGSLYFIDKSECRGPFRLVQSLIKGSVSFTGSTVVNRDDAAIAADRLRVQGSAAFDHGFRVIGGFRLHNCSVGGNLTFRSSKLLNLHGNALTGDGAEIRGNLILKDALAIGEVRFLKASIGGDLVCHGVVLRNKNRTAFNCRSIRIGGGLMWRLVKDVNGEVSFDSANVADLVDDLKSWLKADSLLLDGLSYGRIAGGRSPTDAQRRLQWLRHQNSRKHGTPFWPQPWEHLARVLRDMGHSEDAKQVAIEKQIALAAAGLIGQRPTTTGGLIRNGVNGLSNVATRALHRIYGGLAGFGYRPMKTVLWMVAAWFICGAIYLAAEQCGYFGPSAPLYQTNRQFDDCGGPGQPDAQPWTRCGRLPAEHTKFNAVIYSLDVILPLVDLRQESEWSPIVPEGDDMRAWAGAAVRIVMWMQILFGWVSSLLLASALGRLVQKD